MKKIKQVLNLFRQASDAHLFSLSNARIKNQISISIGNGWIFLASAPIAFVVFGCVGIHDYGVCAGSAMTVLVTVVWGGFGILMIRSGRKMAKKYADKIQEEEGK